MSTKIKIMQIQELLCIKDLKDSHKIAIVFVTHKPCYYDFGSTWFTHLDIEDKDKPDMTQYQVLELDTLIKAKDRFDTIYVCCDAGISRSPSVACYILTKMKLHKQADGIRKKYRFLNYGLYNKLMELSSDD